MYNKISGLIKLTLMVPIGEIIRDTRIPIQIKEVEAQLLSLLQDT